MPVLPPSNPSSDYLNLQRRPRSISSFESDSAERVRLRSEDLIDLDPPIADIATALPRDSSSGSLDTPNDSSNSQPLVRRQIYISNLPATYNGIGKGPSSGTIVGIVLGVVLGYILVCWLIVAIINSNGVTQQYVEGDDTEIVVRRGHDSSRRSRRSHRSRRREEVSEFSEVTQPRRRSPRRPSPRRTERVIVTETVRRAESRPPPPVSPRSEVHESININIREGSRPPRRVDGDDMVEVIEEESSSGVTPDPAPRRKRQSGFRPVDPHAYGGGDYPRQELGSRSRTRR